MKESIEKRIEGRISAVLFRENGPMTVRDLQRLASYRDWNAAQFRSVLESMIRAGVVWHEEGAVELIDRSVKPETLKTPLSNSRDLGIQRPA